MTLSSDIQTALRRAGEWLYSIRKEKGQWQDMVYKGQGILNTAEAWRSLVLIDSEILQVRWKNQWIEQDCRQLIREVGKYGFLRSPYYPSNHPHQSIDSASFVLLMLQAFYASENATMPESTLQLVRRAVDWLVENQGKEGGWSWGELRTSRPLYPYFTYMAIESLRVVKAPEAQKAIEMGINWLIRTQLSDGSFPAHSQSDASDVASTAYASIALSESKSPKARGTLSRATHYLLSASLSDITQLGHLKIIEPDKPPQLAIDYENYSVSANVLLALIRAREYFKDDELSQLDERIRFLVQHLLEQQAPNGGWPKSYATIYVTHTVSEALVAYLKFAQTQPKSTTRQASEHFNPYVFGFPIQHPQLFFGREAIIERIRADMATDAVTKRDIALIGKRRIGKTSLLYQLPYYLLQDGHLTFYLDLELMQNNVQFLQTFIAELGQTIFEMLGKKNLGVMFSRAGQRLDHKLFRQLDIELQTPFFSVSTASRTPDMFRGFLSDVENLLSHFRKRRKSASVKIICILDEIAALKNLADNSLYSLLRGVSQHNPDLVFIVAGTLQFSDSALPFYSIFTPIHLGQLEREAAIELITHPVKGKITYTNEAIEHLLLTSRRQPHILQGLCYHCIRLLPSSETKVDVQVVREASSKWKLDKDWT